MKAPSKIIVLVLSSWWLAACSGGGGDGGNNSKNARRGVRVLHASVEAPPVEAFSSITPETAALRSEFAGSAFYQSLDNADQTLRITTAHRPNDIRFTVPIAKDELGRKTIFVYGDLKTFGLRHAEFLDGESPELTNNETAIRVIDGVTFASSVTVAITGGPNFSGVPFGSMSTYSVFETNDGIVEYVVRRDVDNLPLASGTVTIESGKPYTLLIAGEAEYFVTVRVYEDS